MTRRVYRLFDRDKNGSLVIDGVDVEKVADKVGTPFYVYNATIMREQYRRLKAALPKDVDIHFSMKANPHPAVASVFAKEGAGAEVASKTELESALTAKISPEKILFAGPGKTKEELLFAIRSGIGTINVESATELSAIIKLSKKRKKNLAPVRIAFRVNLDISVKSKTGRVMIGGAQKFGVDDDQLESLVKSAMKEETIDIVGFHSFPGTQITDSLALSGAYEAFANWALQFSNKLNLPVKSLNFGGGLGIPYTDKEQPLDVRVVGKALRSAYKKLIKASLFSDVKFILEPGRYLVGPSGVYVSRVIDIKKSRGEFFVITDGGIHHALVPIVMNKNYPSALINKMDKRRDKEVTVVGPLCSSADRFSRSMKLPSPEIGDLLGIFNSGAYGFTAGMLYFLSHPTPSEVLIDNGKPYLIRQSAKQKFGKSKLLAI